jgi:hypothetical protein
MATTAAGSENVMTDYQFKTILKMVLNILETGNNIEKAKKTIKDLIDGKDTSNDGDE